MTPWFVIALGAVAMCAFGFYVAYLFDSVNEYWKAEPDERLEDAQATKGKGSFS